MSYHYKPYSCHHAIKKYIHKNNHSNDDKGKSVLLIVNLQNDFLLKSSVNGDHKYISDSTNDNMINSVNELIDSDVFDYYVYTQDIHSPNHISLASSHDDRIPFEVIDLNSQPQLLWPDHCISINTNTSPNDGFKFPEKLIAPFVGTDNESIIYDKTKSKDVDQRSSMVEVESILDCSLVLRENPSLKITDLERRLINKSYILQTGNKDNVEPFSAFKNMDKSETGLAKFLIRKRIKNIYVCGLMRNFNAWWTAADATTYENNDTLKKEFRVHFILDATLAGPTSVDIPDNKLLPSNINVDSVLTDLNKNNVTNNKWVQAFLHPYGINTVSWKETIENLQTIKNLQSVKEQDQGKSFLQTLSQSIGLSGGSIFKQRNKKTNSYKKKNNIQHNMQNVDLDFLLRTSK
jgi:nicotinamidase-related amidase